MFPAIQWTTLLGRQLNVLLGWQLNCHPVFPVRQYNCRTNDSPEES